MTSVQIDYSYHNSAIPVIDDSLAQDNWPINIDFNKLPNLRISEEAEKRYAYAKQEQSPCPIKIFTLGRFSIMGNDNFLEISGKGQRKSLELLKALIAMGGREVGELRLSEALWPDSEGDVAHSTFAVTLHRLRKLMGPKALQLSDGRLTLNPQYCWVDVWAVERLFGDIKHILYAKKQECRLIKYLVNEVTNLYHGPYLGPEDEQAWYISYREKLHNKFLNSLLMVGGYLENCQKDELAINLYEKGLEIDDLSEKYYLRLMRCYFKLGFNTEAIKVYNRCTKMLMAHFGMGPSNETVSVYKDILECA